MSLPETPILHKLLHYQLSKCGVTLDNLPPEYQNLIRVVSGSYILFEDTNAETERLFASISSILIGVDSNDCIALWNKFASVTFGLSEATVIGKQFMACGIQWNWLEVLENIAECRDRDQPTQLEDVPFIRPDGRQGFVRMTINPVSDKSLHQGYLLIGQEITENKLLKQQLAQAQKLEAIGHLASGIAHELNTPIQYIGDNVRFVAKAFEGMDFFFDTCKKLLDVAGHKGESMALVETARQLQKKYKIDFMRDEVPDALREMQEGVARISEIVNAMKAYAHPGIGEKRQTDINQTLKNAFTVTSSEWKYHAEIDTILCADLPLVPCLSGEIHQVFINLIVNATHAIIDANQNYKREKGKITATTEHDAEQVTVVISDNGSGIPEPFREKVFDPFFTTKEVGKGTGQGLAISHNVVVEKHGGEISFETEPDKGTTFFVRLPLKPDKAENKSYASGDVEQSV